jgi:hypothetical protein
LLHRQIENEQEVGNVEESDVIGNNLHGKGQNVSNHKNTPMVGHTSVGENSLITGDTIIENSQIILGTGHTINIYQYPKELKELMELLISIAGSLN